MHDVGWRGTVALSVVIAAAGCGFGTYDGTAAPNVVSAGDGVADAGQWWPFVCPDGIYPIPSSTPQAYVATGSCGDGGPLTLNVDGCEMFADWSVLGLSDVQTTQPTSTPNLGGWIITATEADADGGVDGGEVWTCEATPASPGALTFACSSGTPPATVCQSTLTQVVQ
jgi:hypothetical protein